MYIAIIIIAILILLAIIQKNKNQSEEILPYKSKYILTKTEYYFYKILRPITDKHECIICPKIGLKDLVSITDKNEYMKWFSQVNQKHIDFLICDMDLKPLFGLELDDKSHDNPKAFKNDTFKNNLFNSIGIKLVRIKTNNYENLEQILFYDKY